jgi:hypothetical protein
MSNLAATKKALRLVNTTVNGDAIDRNSYAATIASGWDSSYWTPIAVGPGMVASQSAGNGVITTGVTTNSETIFRHPVAVNNNLCFRYKTTLSQRIANQTVFYELVDVIGDSLAITVNSATSITVTFPNSFVPSTANVGQSMSICAISVANSPSGRYVIASVSGQNVNFTVSGFPASGSGTCSVFGWNGIRFTYDGATATSAKFDSYRNGYSSGDTTITINTTASGHVAAAYLEDGFIYSLDAATNSVLFTQRAVRSENVPDQNTNLFLQVRIVNGATAPASTTTVTTGFVHVNDWVSSIISLSRQPGTQGNNMVNVASMPSVVIGSGTITTVSTVTAVTTSGTPLAPATPYILNSLATTNIALILTGTSGLHAFYATNTGATAAFVKLYNKATAPVLASDVPAMIIVVPAAVGGIPGVATLPIGHNGFRFALGLGIAITGGVSDTDTTAVAAGQVKVILSRTV